LWRFRSDVLQRTALALISAGVALSLVACSQQTVRLCDFEKIARKQVAAKYPAYDANKKMAYLDQDDGTRQMYFPPPPGWVGGSPTVSIDRRTCVVRGVYRTQ
jgi:hypothetical protein